MFHCTIRSNGKFKVEEVANFEQDDLDPDDIMVLDGGDEVYVWVGAGSTAEEKEKSSEMAKVRKPEFLLNNAFKSFCFFQEYLRTDPSDRSEETVPLIQVPQGLIVDRVSLQNFTIHFPFQELNREASSVCSPRGTISCGR